jgi:hypothetical protein
MELQAHGDCKHYERHTLSIANPALKEHPESEIVGFLDDLERAANRRR